MVTIEEIITSMFTFLVKTKELDGASIREIGKQLGWNYQKANNIAKALENLGFIRMELTSGPPRRYVVKLTEKGECLLTCYTS